MAEQPVLWVMAGPQAVERFVLSRDAVTVLGRLPDCGVRLSSLSVSRRHAELRPTPHGHRLSDTGSLGGTYVNGRPIESVLLRDGDELVVGVVRLVFHADDDAADMAEPTVLPVPMVDFDTPTVRVTRDAGFTPLGPCGPGQRILAP